MLSYRNCNTLYVSPNGNGNGKNFHENEPGCGPLRSIENALGLVEQMRGGGMLQPITIKLMAGEYCLSSPLVIRPVMSNVTIEPFGDGPVLISGGRKITGFTETEFNGVPCFGAYIPDVKDGKWNFTDLYVDGLRADKTRLPSDGYFRMKETENPTTELFGPSKWFTAEEADLEKFRTLYAFSDIIVSFNHYWIDEHTPIESLDHTNGRVTMTYRTRFNIRPNQEYILENVAEQFHKSNEWYLDRANGMLYYIPRDDRQKPENIDVWAPVSDKLVTIVGGSTGSDFVSGVRFRDITFAYTRGDYASGMTTDGAQSEKFASDSQAVSNAHGTIEVSYARNIVFSGCTVRNFGVHAFNLKEGCRSVRIEGCTVYDGGAGGVRICGGAYGAPESTMTTGCTVSDCSITHIGRRYYSACGILIMHAAEIDVIHNEIGDLYYTGVSVGWTWGYAKTVCRDNRIVGNHIYDLGKGFLSDMGGVYLLGSQPGTVVSNNRIHDIKCKEYGGWALYTDEGSAGITLENNLCYRTSSNSYHQHYGSSNVVRNNIFADAGEPMLRCSRPEAHLSIMFYGNIVYSTGSEILADYAQGASGSFGVEDGSIVSMRNLIWCRDGEVVYCSRDNLRTLAGAQDAGLEMESIEADPLFVDFDRDDFTLRPDSPAFGLGFCEFDWKSCGVRKTVSEM
ncbi:MAG: right-handed parallel beta-helix repeat-containing protein [Eubacteriales bacterium]